MTLIINKQRDMADETFYRQEDDILTRKVDTKIFVGMNKLIIVFFRKVLPGQCQCLILFHFTSHCPSNIYGSRKEKQIRVNYRYTPQNHTPKINSVFGI